MMGAARAPPCVLAVAHGHRARPRHGAGPAAAAPAADRPAGTVSDWSHELNEEELPEWRRGDGPALRPAAWYRTIDGILTTAGDERPLLQRGRARCPSAAAAEPEGADRLAHARPASMAAVPARPACVGRRGRGVGRAANALHRKTAVVSDPATDRAYARRLSLLDPGYRRRGAARDPPHRPDRSATARTSTSTRAATSRSSCCPAGQGPAHALRPAAGARVPRGRPASPCPTRTPGPRASPPRRLRWLAWSRYSGHRFFRHEGRAGAPHPPARPRPPSSAPTTTASSTASSPGTTPACPRSPTWSRPTRT